MSSLIMTSLKELFRTLLGEAMNHQGLAVAEGTEFYLVNLLSEFVSAEKLFTQDEAGHAAEEPLALIYHKAMQQDRDGKIRTLRRLGDVSLYKAGFFSSALREKAVGPDYYIQMGGTAYRQVADLAPGSAFSSIYRELCDKFRGVVDVLEEIAARGLVANGPVGAMQVYESWARTGSERLERVLIEAGVLVPKGALPN
jgi:hypothetical protein